MLSVDRRTIWPRRTAGNRTSTAGRWLTRPPRPLRFATVGGGCAVLQLLALALLVQLGVERHLANIFAFLLSAQVNFALSSNFSWRDRRAGADRWPE